MSRSIVSASVAALMLAFGAAPISPALAQQAIPTPEVSQSFRETFRAAQGAKKAQRWPEVIARAQEVLASSKRKPDDTYYAYYLLYEAYNAQGNRVESLKSLQGLVNAGFLNAAQSAQYVNAVMGLAFQARDYDTAIEYGNRLIKSGHADAPVYTTIGQSYYQKGDYAGVARFFKDLIDEQLRRGQKPLENNLTMVHSAYQKLKDRDGVTHTLEMLVVWYPKAQYWDALLYSIRGDSSLQPREKLQVYRLMWATGTLKLASDYSRFAELAQLVGLHAEAQRVYEAGIKAGVFASDTERQRAERLRDSAARSAEGERARLPKMEAEAASARTGEGAVALGMAYYSFGQPEKAITALQQGLAKGGMNEDQAVEASLVLGMAQLRARDNVAAIRTFKGIRTGNARMQRIANLWALHASGASPFQPR